VLFVFYFADSIIIIICNSSSGFGAGFNPSIRCIQLALAVGVGAQG